MANLVTSLAAVTVTITPQPVAWWLKNPSDPDLNIPISAVSWSISQKRPVAKFDPVGRTRSVILRGPILGEEGTLSVRTLTESDATALRAILDSQQTLLLQNVLGEQWYVEVNGDIGRTQIRSTSIDARPVRHHYDWSIPFCEVDIP